MCECHVSNLKYSVFLVKMAWFFIWFSTYGLSEIPRSITNGTKRKKRTVFWGKTLVLFLKSNHRLQGYWPCSAVCWNFNVSAFTSLSVSANIYKIDAWRFLWLAYPLINWQAIIYVAVQVYDMLLGLFLINF